MKNCRILFFLAIIWFLGLNMACRTSRSVEELPMSQLIGYWTIENIHSESANKINPDALEQATIYLQELLSDSYWQFAENGTYTLSLLGETRSGTWQMHKDRQHVLVTDDGTVTTYRITSVGKNSLSLQIIDNTADKLTVLMKREE